MNEEDPNFILNLLFGIIERSIEKTIRILKKEKGEDSLFSLELFKLIVKVETYNLFTSDLFLEEVQEIIQNLRIDYNIYNKKKGLPLIEAKIAVSNDFFTINKKSKRITNERSEKITHLLRSKYDSIISTSKSINEDKDSVRRPEITSDAVISKLISKLKKPAETGIKSSEENIELKDLLEIYVPIFEARLIGPKKRIKILRIDAIRKKIL